jgi:hypothetical protein
MAPDERCLDDALDVAPLDDVEAGRGPNESVMAVLHEDSAVALIRMSTITER